MWDVVRSIFIWLGIATISFTYFWVAIVHALVMYEPTRKVGPGWARRWAKSIVALNSAWQITVDDKRLPKGRHFVIVSNHMSTADIIVHLHLMHHFKFISRRSNFDVPITGWYMWLAGYIPLERGKKSSIKECMDRSRKVLDQGVSVLFYPEGTRSPDGEVQGFKRGAFQLAIEAGVDVLPIAVAGTRTFLPKDSLIYNSDDKPMTMLVGDPISVAGMTLEDVPALTEKARAAVIELHAEAERRSQLRLVEMARAG